MGEEEEAFEDAADGLFSSGLKRAVASNWSREVVVGTAFVGLEDGRICAD